MMHGQKNLKLQHILFIIGLNSIPSAIGVTIFGKFQSTQYWLYCREPRTVR